MEGLDIFVEERSAEAFLRATLPRWFPGHRAFKVIPHEGKDDLLAKLESRLKVYAGGSLRDRRVVVLVDRDADDCLALKRRLESIAAKLKLTTRTQIGGEWRVANRIAIEELEAWYFGEWAAVQTAYPRAKLSKAESTRNSDFITGGTWEQFERVLQRAGYFKGGLRKIELARNMAPTSIPIAAHLAVSAGFMKRSWKRLPEQSRDPGSSAASRRPGSVDDQAGAKERPERADRERVERVRQRLRVGAAGKARIVKSPCEQQGEAAE